MAEEMKEGYVPEEAVAEQQQPEEDQAEIDRRTILKLVAGGIGVAATTSILANCTTEHDEVEGQEGEPPTKKGQTNPGPDIDISEPTAEPTSEPSSPSPSDEYEPGPTNPAPTTEATASPTPTKSSTSTPTSESDPTPTTEPTASPVSTKDLKESPAEIEKAPYNERVFLSLESEEETRFANFVFSADERFYDPNYSKENICKPEAWVDGRCPEFAGVKVNDIYTPEQVGHNFENYFYRNWWVNVKENYKDYNSLSFDEFLEKIEDGSAPDMVLYGTKRGEDEKLNLERETFNPLKGEVHFVSVGKDLAGIHKFSEASESVGLRFVNDGEGENEDLHIEMYNPYVYPSNSSSDYIGSLIFASGVLASTEGQRGGFSSRVLDELWPKLGSREELFSDIYPNGSGGDNALIVVSE